MTDMTATTSDHGLIARLRASRRILLKEIAAFGAVGAIAFVVQFGLLSLLLYGAHLGPITATGISMAVATLVAYVGNRNYSFSHRARSGLARESLLFFGINAVAFGFTVLMVWFAAYPLGYKDNSHVTLGVNVLSVGIGTVFRFWSYKRFVFLHPDKVHAKHVDLDVELAE
jgi:putative flippase GtrA